MCRAPALPAIEAEAGSQSTPGLRRALESADEAAEKMPSVAGLPGQQPLMGDQIEDIPSTSGVVTADERRVSESSNRQDHNVL